VAAVVFDIDGTLLDSADGIVAGFRYALRFVGFEAPDAATLRSDLGPPVGQIFLALGLSPDRIEPAIAAYRRFYLNEGVAQSVPYPGITAALDRLAASGVRLGIATAKRTDLALAILRHHNLEHLFEAIGGAEVGHPTKDATLAHTLDLMGLPASAIMLGDRHSDIAAGHACGVRPIAVSWGYGTIAELVGARPERIIDHPAEVVALARVGINAD